MLAFFFFFNSQHQNEKFGMAQIRLMAANC